MVRTLLVPVDAAVVVVVVVAEQAVVAERDAVVQQQIPLAGAEDAAAHRLRTGSRTDSPLVPNP